MTNDQIFEQIKTKIPGGVNSPVRSYSIINTTPKVMSRGKGSHIFDVEGNEYIDYTMAYGAMILGHGDPETSEAIAKAARDGAVYGASTPYELELAELITDAIPHIEKLRFTCSGTEACMSAMRLARGYTKRNYIIKFEGCYHGHTDAVLKDSGSGAKQVLIEDISDAAIDLSCEKELGNNDGNSAGAIINHPQTLPGEKPDDNRKMGQNQSFNQENDHEPDDSGIPYDYMKYSITLPYNDFESVEKVFAQMGEQIAGVIVEPIAANMNVVFVKDGWLEHLRRLTQKFGALLIYDEVITAFRVCYGSAVKLVGVKPDITVLGKIIGGCVSVGAYGAGAEIMDHIAPVGHVYQSGTFAGNPLMCHAGVATLKKLKTPGFYEKLEENSKYFEDGFKDTAKRYGFPITFNRVGSLIGLFFKDEIIDTYEKATNVDLELFRKFILFMLEEKIWLAPSPYETIFLCDGHTKEDVDRAVEGFEGFLKRG